MNDLEAKILKLEAENRQLQKNDKIMLDGLKAAHDHLKKEKLNFRDARKAKKVIKETILERLGIYE